MNEKSNADSVPCEFEQHGHREWYCTTHTTTVLDAPNEPVRCAVGWAHADSVPRNKRPYHVWRRDDGYVGATVGPPHSGPKGFTELLVTWDWAEAHDLIAVERAQNDGSNHG